ncbi:MAG: SMP-30/gluconolactonase/LRE family protein [Anaerolineales bacterium]
MNDGSEPQVVADRACHTGEAPLWHPSEQALYWVDIPRGRLYRYSPNSAETELCLEGPPVGGLTLQPDGALLLFMQGGAVRRWQGDEITTLVEGIPGEQHNRFNDVVADPEGRVFCGTMPAEDHAARLYRLDLDGGITLLVEGLGMSNGLDLSPDMQRLYHVDTRKGIIHVYDYERTTGELRNRRPFVEVGQDLQGKPDGLVVDVEGHIWVAFYGGGAIIRYHPDGSRERRIELPVSQVTSLAFGGLDYTDLYITTAGGDNREKNGAAAGALFRMRPGVQGKPPFLSRVRG